MIEQFGNIIAGLIHEISLTPSLESIKKSYTIGGDSLSFKVFFSKNKINVEVEANSVISLDRRLVLSEALQQSQQASMVIVIDKLMPRPTVETSIKETPIEVKDPKKGAPTADRRSKSLKNFAASVMSFKKPKSERKDKGASTSYMPEADDSEFTMPAKSKWSSLASLADSLQSLVSNSSLTGKQVDNELYEEANEQTLTSTTSSSSGDKPQAAPMTEFEDKLFNQIYFLLGTMVKGNVESGAFDTTITSEESSTTVTLILETKSMGKMSLSLSPYTVLSIAAKETLCDALENLVTPLKYHTFQLNYDNIMLAETAPQESMDANSSQDMPNLNMETLTNFVLGRRGSKYQSSTPQSPLNLSPAGSGSHTPNAPTPPATPLSSTSSESVESGTTLNRHNARKSSLFAKLF